MDDESNQKKLLQLLLPSSQDHITGIPQAGNMYFGSPRTKQIVRRSFLRLFKKLDPVTADAFAGRALHIARSPYHKTLLALNNHDGKENECGKLAAHLFPKSLWNQLWDIAFIKGQGHVDSEKSYSLVCWDNKHQIVAKEHLKNEDVLAHELIGHVYHRLADPIGHMRRLNTPTPAFENQEEEHTIQEIDNKILSTQGLPLRTTHEDNFMLGLQMAFDRLPIEKNFVDSKLSAEVPRSLPYIIRGIQAPSTDEHLPNWRGLGYAYTSKALNASPPLIIALTGLAVMTQSRQAYNAAKKLISLPVDIYRYITAPHKPSPEERKDLSPEEINTRQGFGRAIVSARLPVPSGAEPMGINTSDIATEPIQSRTTTEDEWSKNTTKHTFKTGGTLRRDSEDPTYALFTPKERNEPALRFLIQDIPLPTSLANNKEKFKKYLDGENGFVIGKLIVDGDKIRHWQSSAPVTGRRNVPSMTR